MGFFDFFKSKNVEELQEETLDNESVEQEHREEGTTSDTLPYGGTESEAENGEGATDPLIETEDLTLSQQAGDSQEEVIDEVVEEMAENESSLNPEESIGFFARLAAGLKKTRDAISNQVDLILNSFTTIDEDLLEELEESLIMADVGSVTSLRIIDALREEIKRTGETNPQNLKGMIRDIVAGMLEGDNELDLSTQPSVILVIGVNGAGKTTSIGKIAHRLEQQGKSVLLAAADTFRAAAIEQLEVWSQRANADLVKHQEGSDPAAVIYDALQAGKARKKDVIICDTAGRLHNKTHLMEELAKMRRVIDKELPHAAIESLLVLDATTGQNALNQARQFKEVADITGIILTKLDGTAKGGVVIGMKEELNIPIKFIGVGEQIDDLRPFDPIDFANALFQIEEPL